VAMADSRCCCECPEEPHVAKLIAVPSLSGPGSPGSMFLSTRSAILNLRCVWCLQAAASPVTDAVTPAGLLTSSNYIWREPVKHLYYSSSTLKCCFAELSFCTPVNVMSIKQGQPV
jgi:hypothetical protein